MRIALINVVKSSAPPLGLVYLAAYINRNIDIEDIRIFDINVHNIKREIEEFSPALVGISSMTVRYGLAIKMARDIKSAINVPVIIGGPHISTLPGSLHNVFDAGVIGEGEETLLELVRLYLRKGAFHADELKNIDGVVYLEDGENKVTKPRALISPLDKTANPDRGKFLHSKYFMPQRTFNNKICVESSIMTSRGCPYKCAFCSTTVLWEKMRFYSINCITEEIKELVKKYNVKAMRIQDDLFAVSLKRLQEMIEHFHKERLIGKVDFNCQGRINLITDELCEALKVIGVKQIGFGFESGNNRILRYLKGSGITVEDIFKSVGLCRKHGFDIRGSVIFGTPGESLSDMQDTLRMIKKLRQMGVSAISAYVMTPYPGTPVWQEFINRRGIDSINWEEFNELTGDNKFNNYSVENPMLLNKDVSLKDFKKVFALAFSPYRFYTLQYYLKTPWDTLKKAVAHPRKLISGIKKIFYFTFSKNRAIERFGSRPL